MGKSTLVHVCVGCVIPQRHSRHTATTTPITIATTTLGSKQNYNHINTTSVRVAYCSNVCHTLAGWAKKRGHRLVTIILSNLNRFKKNR